MKHIFKRKKKYTKPRGSRLNPWQEKITLSNQAKQNKTESFDTYSEKKSNLITTNKSSYYLKSNLFSRPNEANL